MGIGTGAGRLIEWFVGRHVLVPPLPAFRTMATPQTISSSRGSELSSTKRRREVHQEDLR
jgi:hypothetical protein